MKTLLRILICTVLITQAPVYAWWGLGHMVVGDIAYDNLTPHTKKRIDVLVEQFQKSYPEVDSFQKMAVWADTLYGSQKIFLHFHWHFIDTPIYTDSITTPFQVDSDNAVWAVQNIAETLKSAHANLHEQARMLAFLIHIVGDIHQPLHNVTRISKQHPQGDRGGNDFFIVHQGQRINLHKVWDNAFGLFVAEQTVPVAKAISRRLTATYSPHYFGERVQTIDPTTWSHEGFSNANEYAYKTVEEKNTSAQYIAAGKKLTEEEVTLAGYRLAKLLNTILP